MLRLLSLIRKDQQGATVVEFAMIAPVLTLTLMGLFDFSYNFYAKTMIEGAIQKAARDSTIESYAANPNALDSKVQRAVQNVVPSATVAFSRSGYTNYRDMGRPEDFTDTNGDGTCNDNEPFDDANGNGTWDADRSLTDSDGARDAVMYRVDATYDRAFPLAEMIGFEQTVTVSATTVLRNQPFNTQQDVATVGNCA